MTPLVPFLLSLAVLGPSPDPPRPLAGELVRAVEDVTGLEVDGLLRDWSLALDAAGGDPLAAARPGTAPAGFFERGPALPLHEMVVQVPVLSF